MRARVRSLFSKGPFPPASAPAAGAALAQQAEQSGLEIVARALVDGLRQGRHRSSLRGGATEFYDYRAAGPTDPASAVDWKVYGRTDRAYIRRRRHESQQTVVIVLDGSASMAFAGLPDEARRERREARGPTKLRRAAELAAACAWLAVRQGDRVALIATGDGPEIVVPPGAGMPHLRTVMSELERVRAGGEAGLARALERSAQLARDGGVVLAFSDALDDADAIVRAAGAARWSGASRSAPAACGHGRDVVLVQVLTDDELDLSALSRARLLDPEGGAAADAGGEEAAELYARALAAHQARLREGLAAIGARLCVAPTSAPALRTLAEVLGT